MTTALLAGATGLALGIVMTRGGVCFNSGMRRAVRDRDLTILRIFAFAVAVQLLLLPMLLAVGIEPLGSSVEAGTPALLPVAAVVGGLGFGIGIVLAGGCITGILWKAGAGSVATAIAIAGFAIGELLAQGPGEAALDALDEAARPPESSLQGLLGIPFEVLAPVIGLAAFAGLLASGRRGIAFGVGVGMIAALAWVVADLAGYGYGLGFVGAAEQTRAALADGSALPFPLYLALGVLAGGAVAARGPLRMPDGRRAAGALAGGALMGVGASAAHGCNIGHGVTGLGLLSLGSLLTVAAMAAGAIVALRVSRRNSARGIPERRPLVKPALGEPERMA